MKLWQILNKDIPDPNESEEYQKWLRRVLCVLILLGGIVFWIMTDALTAGLWMVIFALIAGFVGLLFGGDSVVAIAVYLLLIVLSFSEKGPIGSYKDEKNLNDKRYIKSWEQNMRDEERWRRGED